MPFHVQGHVERHQFCEVLLCVLHNLGNGNIVCAEHFHEVADSGVCLFLGRCFEVHDEFGGAFGEEGEGESGSCGVAGKLGVRCGGGVDGDCPDCGVGEGVYVGVVGFDVVD